MSIAVLLASSRSAGNTRALVDLAFPGGGYSFEDLAALDVGFHSYEHDNDADDFLPLMKRLLAYRTWVIATPLYWYTMSAQAKAFLDRLSDLLELHQDLGRLLRGKRLAVLCTGTDAAAPDSFAEPFRLTCEYLGMEFAGVHYAQFQGLYPARSSARAEAESFANALVSGAAGQETHPE